MTTPAPSAPESSRQAKGEHHRTRRRRDPGSDPMTRDHILARLAEVAPTARHGDDLVALGARNALIREARDMRATYAEIMAASGLSRAMVDRIVHGRD